MPNEPIPQDNHTTNTTGNTASNNTPATPVLNINFPPKSPETLAVPSKTVGELDLGKIIIVQKDAPSAASAQRVNAGAVLEAGAAPLQQSPETAVARAEIPAKIEALHTDASQNAPAGIAIHTYRSDVEQSVRTKSMSVSDMISKDNTRGNSVRSNINDESSGEQQSTSFDWKILAGSGIIVLSICLPAFMSWFMTQTPQTTPAAPTPTNTFIHIDTAKSVTITPGETPGTVLKQLTQERDNITMSLGLIGQLNVIQGATGTRMTTQDFLSSISPNIPSTLGRHLYQQFMLGAHFFNGKNAPFLLFKTDSYSQAYSDMLSWEGSMRADLSPLFGLVLPTDWQENLPLLAPESTTTTNTSGTLTNINSPRSSQISTSNITFADRSVENHSARVAQDAQGNILLMWVFIDRNTLVITTNSGTLREIISRLSNASVVPVLN